MGIYWLLNLNYVKDDMMKDTCISFKPVSVNKKEVLGLLKLRDSFIVIKIFCIKVITSYNI